MSGPASKLFGKLAVDLGYVDDDQVSDALRVQEALTFQGRPLALGTILRNLGYITAGELEEVLRQQREDVRGDLNRREAALFGELAIENGFASREQIEAALAIQNAAPQAFRIGSILVSRNAITDEERSVLLKAIERIVRDAKRGATAAPGRAPKRAGRKSRPFSGLFLFDADSGDSGED